MQYEIPRYKWGRYSKRWAKAICSMSDKKQRLMYHNCIQKGGMEEILKEHFLFDDYILMLNTISSLNNRADILSTIRIHLKYNPLVEYSLRLRYDKAYSVFYGIWRFKRPNWRVLNEDYFVPHFLDILQKYSNGEYNFEELFSALVTYVEFYNVVYSQSTINYLFTTHAYKMIPAKVAYSEFPEYNLCPLPDRSFRTHYTEEIKNGEYYGVKTNNDVHCFIICGGLGNTMIWFDRSMRYDRLHLLYDPRISYIISGLGLLNVVFEATYGLHRKSDDALVECSLRDLTEKTGTTLNGKHNYDKYYPSVEIFDFYSTSECRLNHRIDKYSKRYSDLKKFFSGIKSNRIRVADVRKIEDHDWFSKSAYIVGDNYCKQNQEYVYTPYLTYGVPLQKNK